MSRHLPTAACAVFLAFGAAASAAWSQECPAGPFETDLAKLARPIPAYQLDDLAWGDRPSNYSRLVNGKRGDYAGAHLNDGLSRTWVFDFDAGALTEIVRRQGKFNVERAPAPADLRANQQQRRRGEGEAEEVETMSVWTYTPEDLREFACLANKALIPPPPPPPVEQETSPLAWLQSWGYRLRLLKPIAMPPMEPEPFEPMMTDTLWSNQDLVVNGKAGRLPAEAEALDKAMNDVIFRPQIKARGY